MNGRSWSYIWYGALVLTVVLWVVWRISINAALAHNGAMLALSQAELRPEWRYQARDSLLETAGRWAIAGGPRAEWVVLEAMREKEALGKARAYLETHSIFQDYAPGRQLLNNPAFAMGRAHWTQYNSLWHVLEQDAASRKPAWVSLVHEGQGHASLSQTVTLHPGRCYLFSATGAAERFDDTPTFWFYWETYDENDLPSGQSLQPGRGAQPWEDRFDIFCLPANNRVSEKITVAPVVVYGVATIYLADARLYELQKQP
jgi:hypothetical protein